MNPEIRSTRTTARRIAGFGLSTILALGAISSGASASSRVIHEPHTNPRTLETHKLTDEDIQAFGNTLSLFEVESNRELALMTQRHHQDYNSFFESLKVPNGFGYVYFPDGKEQPPRLSFTSSAIDLDSNHFLTQGQINVQLSTDGSFKDPADPNTNISKEKVVTFINDIFTLPRDNEEVIWIEEEHKLSNGDTVNSYSAFFEGPNGKLVISGNTKAGLMLYYEIIQEKPKQAGSPSSPLRTPMPMA